MSATLNRIGLGRDAYKGAATTLCAGCGHNSITNHLIKALYELGIEPSRLAKYSCSFQNETKGKTSGARQKGHLERKKTKVDLSRVGLTELAAEIEKRGGEVSFKKAKIKRVR